MTEEKTVRRLDIQALRFVAVASVVLFHAELPYIDGGFIGVDIFFVISGFLIIGMLYREFQSTNTINVMEFWARRMRRLMPAATLVICTTLFFTHITLGPFVAKNAAVDSMWASFYTANIRFALSASDYFSSNSQSPLLHFWSLGVEEQFYIGLPLILIFFAWIFQVTQVFKFFVLLLVSTFVFSFSVLLYLKLQMSPWEFYGPISRFWEFAIGGMVAIVGQNQEKTAPSTFNGSPSLNLFIGLSWATVLSSFFVINFQDVNANLKSIIPILATAVLLYLNPNIRHTSNLEGRLLALKLVQKLGDYSYSLYLWHWPVLILGFTILKIDVDELSIRNYLQIMLLIAISISLAFFTWRYVEEPIRRNKSLVKKPRLSMTLGIALSLTSFALALALTQNSLSKLSTTPTVTISNSPDAIFLNSDEINNIIETYSPKITSADENSKDARDLVARSQEIRNVSEVDGCFVSRSKRVNPQDACVYGSDTGERWVLFGDSFANMWMPGLMPAGENDTYGLELQTRGICSPALFPIFDAKIPGGRSAECEMWRDEVIDRLLSNPPEVIIIGSSWLSNYKVASAKGEVETNEKLARAIQEEGLNKLLSKLPKESLIIYIRATPRMSFDVPECLSRNVPKNCKTATVNALDSKNLDVKIVSNFKNVKLLDLTNALCSEEFCYGVRSGSMVFRDSGHVTAEYSSRLHAMFKEIVKFLQNSPTN